MSRYSSIEEAARNIPLLHTAQKYGVPADEVILALVDQNEMLVARVIELEMIAPKKVRDMGGKTWIYRCPDSLVPDAHL